MRTWLIAVVFAMFVVGCKRDVPAAGSTSKPAPPLTCTADTDCVLELSDPCMACSTCESRHVNAEPKVCPPGKEQKVQCVLAPCSIVVAACIDGRCTTKPKERPPVPEGAAAP